MIKSLFDKMKSGERMIQDMWRQEAEQWFKDKHGGTALKALQHAYTYGWGFTETSATLGQAGMGVAGKLFSGFNFGVELAKLYTDRAEQTAAMNQMKQMMTSQSAARAFSDGNLQPLLDDLLRRKAALNRSGVHLDHLATWYETQSWDGEIRVHVSLAWGCGLISGGAAVDSSGMGGPNSYPESRPWLK